MISTLLLGFALGSAYAAPLKPGLVVTVAGPAGGYDYVVPDFRLDRIYAAHSRVGGLTVLDLKTNTAKDYAGPKCNGIWVDVKDNLIFSAGADKKLVQWDRQTMEIKKTVDLTGPGDALAFDSKRRELYVDEDDGTNVFVFDPMTLELKASVKIKEAPEWVQYDSGTDKVYQNIKSVNVMQVVDPETHTVTKEYTLTGLTGPHGMAIDGKAKKAFSAGSNGKLVQIDLETGNVEATVDIAPHVDQICYDRKLGNIYCAGGGMISVVKFDGKTITSLGQVPAAKGVHTIAVDSKSHGVWVAYSDAKASYMAQYVPTTMPAN